jgi:uncharacterized protein YrrD
MRGTTDLRALEGRVLLGQDGEKIGTVSEIYVDDDSGAAVFALITSGLFGTRRHFVPIHAVTDAGEQLEVPYTKDMVSEAPSLETDGDLSEADEDELYRYYGIRKERTDVEDPERRI